MKADNRKDSAPLILEMDTDALMKLFEELEALLVPSVFQSRDEFIDCLFNVGVKFGRFDLSKTVRTDDAFLLRIELIDINTAASAMRAAKFQIHS
ncbi:hypothetical protein YA15_13335 [Klebsiella aerogenes]|uniref:hypothetical protein n=1 Tax=Klebsiella aerogenes TaxID=548 RepID=UPI00063CB025|nr:hypothetical protein [Klebsiella aerogenes]KLE66860.1 hypothetical protein YA15_13335 [Klebsiella aerogenes]